MKNIIIFRTDRLGDYIIHSRPIYEIKKRHKDIKMIIICSKVNEKILKNLNYIDNIIVYDQKAPLLKKIQIFFKIIRNKYYATFILDGKKFSYLCNIFIKANYKFGLSYQYTKKIFNIPFTVFRPGRIYNYFFFNKISYFTARKYLKESVSLCQKYLDLFNFLNLNRNYKDSYIFDTIDLQRKF